MPVQHKDCQNIETLTVQPSYQGEVFEHARVEMRMIDFSIGKYINEEGAILAIQSYARYVESKLTEDGVIFWAKKPYAEKCEYDGKYVGSMKFATWPPLPPAILKPWMPGVENA